MKRVLKTFILLSTIVSFISCVSSKKFKESEAQNQQLQTDLGSCKTSLTNQTADASKKIDVLNTQVSSLSAQNAAMTPQIAEYKKLKSEHQAEIDRLNASLAAKGTSVDEIREKVIAGFSQLADSGIAVTMFNGFLYVDLPETLLFKEGSAVLNKKSGATLSPFASVLNQYPRVNIYVIGHTDTAKIHNATFKDNWSLSTERANSVVRILRDSYHVDPARLLAAGRSKYSPIASNETKEGRTSNRRIEIIIDPNFRGLWVEAMVE